MGLFVTLADPTAPMKTEADSAGVLDTPFGKFPRLQIVTIEDLFVGKGITGTRYFNPPASADRATSGLPEWCTIPGIPEGGGSVAISEAGRPREPSTASQAELLLLPIAHG